jgi:hypothetical protein
MPIDQPESRLVYSTDPLERPPVIRTHIKVRSLATAAHLAALGVYVEAMDGHWRVPVTAKRDVVKYEQTFYALRSGAERRREGKQQQPAMQPAAQ